MTLVPIAPQADYAGIRSARLDSPRILSVRFDDESELRVPVKQLPFSEASSAIEARIIADGDAVELRFAEGAPLLVMADELKGIAEGSLGSSSVSAAVGSNLRRMRTEMGLTLADLELLTGIAVPNLSTIESGRVTPRLETLMRLASGLRIPLAHLVQPED